MARHVPRRLSSSIAIKIPGDEASHHTAKSSASPTSEATNLRRMASRQDQASYRDGEAKARAEEKTGHVMGSAQEKARDAKDTVSDAAGHAMDRSGDAKEATKEKAYEAKDVASDATGRAMDKGRGAAEATKEKGCEAKDKAAGTEAAKQKASGAAQYTVDTAHGHEADCRGRQAVRHGHRCGQDRPTSSHRYCL
nr:late embryogenesis abundant protein 14-like isoform X2 [Lolium perenne]